MSCYLIPAMAVRIIPPSGFSCQYFLLRQSASVLKEGVLLLISYPTLGQNFLPNTNHSCCRWRLPFFAVSNQSWALSCISLITLAQSPEGQVCTPRVSLYSFNGRWLISTTSPPLNWDPDVEFFVEFILGIFPCFIAAPVE